MRLAPRQPFEPGQQLGRDFSRAELLDELVVVASGARRVRASASRGARGREGGGTHISMALPSASISPWTSQGVTTWALPSPLAVVSAAKAAGTGEGAVEGAAMAPDALPEGKW